MAGVRRTPIVDQRQALPGLVLSSNGFSVETAITRWLSHSRGVLPPSFPHTQSAHNLECTLVPDTPYGSRRREARPLFVALGDLDPPHVIDTDTFVAFLIFGIHGGQWATMARTVGLSVSQLQLLFARASGQGIFGDAGFRVHVAQVPAPADNTDPYLTFGLSNEPGRENEYVDLWVLLLPVRIQVNPRNIFVYRPITRVVTGDPPLHPAELDARNDMNGKLIEDSIKGCFSLSGQSLHLLLSKSISTTAYVKQLVRGGPSPGPGNPLFFGTVPIIWQSGTVGEGASSGAGGVTRGPSSGMIGVKRGLEIEDEIASEEEDLKGPGVYESAAELALLLPYEEEAEL